MRKSVPVALVLVVVLLFGIVGPVMAEYDPTPYINESSRMRADGKMSTNLIHHAVVDLSTVEAAGTVTAVVYETVYENITINNFANITSQAPASCTNKLTRFVFALSNQYRPETTCAIGISADRLTANVYTFGQLKDQAMHAFLTGIPDCLNNLPYVVPYSGGSSGSSSDSTNNWINKYDANKTNPQPVVSFQVVAFTISQNTYLFNGETQTMDVKPYIKDNRTYVPVRYLAYALGVQKENIAWTQSSQKVTVVKDDTTVEMFIGNDTMYVNDEAIKMDVAPEITDDRTMLPARWLAEALGAEVSWDDTTKQATIKIAQPGD